MIASVLSQASTPHMRLDPFPHLVIENALPAEDYRRLQASFPPMEAIVGSSPAHGLASNRRYSMSSWPLLLRDDVAACWKTFLQHHTSPQFLEEVFARFSGHWDIDLVPVLKHAVSDGDAGLLHRDAHRTGRVLLDARVEINSPVSKAASSARGAHLDTPNRLYSGLFYLRSEEDDSTGGELDLYTWKEQPASNIDVFELPADMVQKVGSIPYRANQLVMFPQSMLALHGVGIRYPTPHIRRYVFITAEIGYDWLSGEQASPKLAESVA
ncbi:hypothetical protein J2T09_000013 [Neorhizobium huautlense]|uniref:Prolyl 4-hydroxylase alpha subunit Fe(2+) 2OG dioxygenase domain-containing protein n=1 Tax=Neorhizobium huautlense TaxID=67774 RepID=A0ABT9PLC0_9HYPH|nr:2OG-Fe(II) oxygenase [Neorhizobium huautlense]MDP9835272.1 hypothetical protein [Neorhizobium huautlense]